MKHKLLLKGLTSLVLSIILFTACQDPQTSPTPTPTPTPVPTPTPTQRFRLKQYYESQPGSATVVFSNLTYDSTGRLASYTQNGGITSTLFYNNQGQLIRQSKSISSRTIEIDTYTSNANGKITTIKTTFYSRGNAPMDQTTQIEYNADQLPNKITITGSSASTFYEYSNGNIVTVRNSSSTIPTATYIYDDKKNPFYGLIGFLAQFNGTANELFEVFNKNNLIRPGCTYQYDSNGLLTNVTYGLYQSQIVYEYETY